MTTPDEKHKIWASGFEQGQKHSKPSPDTEKFMTTINMEIKSINEKLDKIPTRDEMLLCIEKAVEKTLEKADERYASKGIEKAVWFIFGAIVVSFIGFLGWFIFKGTVHFSI